MMQFVLEIRQIGLDRIYFKLDWLQINYIYALHKLVLKAFFFFFLKAGVKMCLFFTVSVNEKMLSRKGPELTLEIDICTKSGS